MARFAQSSPRALTTIRRRETFDTTGNLSGAARTDYDPRHLVNVAWGRSHPWFGHALIEAAEQGATVDYVLWSFRTPIAVHVTVHGDASVARSYWILDIVSYSSRSARALSVVHGALVGVEEPVIRAGGLYLGWKWLTDVQRQTLIELGELDIEYVTPSGHAKRTFAILQRKGFVVQDGFNPDEYRLSQLAHDTFANIKAIR